LGIAFGDEYTKQVRAWNELGFTEADDTALSCTA
jgi:hypothetical protein